LEGWRNRQTAYASSIPWVLLSIGMPSPALASMNASSWLLLWAGAAASAAGAGDAPWLVHNDGAKDVPGRAHNDGDEDVDELVSEWAWCSIAMQPPKTPTRISAVSAFAVSEACGLCGGCPPSSAERNSLIRQFVTITGDPPLSMKAFGPPPK